MPIFSLRKKKEEQPGTSPTTPQITQENAVNIINSLKQQGFDNNQIIQYLQRSGYNSNQIFDAMNQTEIGGTANQLPPEAMKQPEQMQPEGPLPPNMPPQGMPPPVTPSPDIPPPGIPPVDVSGERERIEELAETIIDEKWEEFSKNINKIIEWKNKTEAKVAKLEQQFMDLKESFNKLHSAIIGKIGEYDQNIQNVGTEIKAMEKVFQKILPTFTDNVNELSRVTKKLKG